jgi:hypothetical protein
VAEPSYELTHNSSLLPDLESPVYSDDEEEES